MIVECPDCHTKFRLTEKQLAGRSEVKVRCTKCGAIITARAEASPQDGGPIALGGDFDAEATLASAGTRPMLPPGKTVSLAVTRGPLKGKVFRLEKPQIVIGRVGSDIVVDDAEVSRKHCGLEVHGISATLIDLGSTNGTFVNDVRVESCEIDHLTEFRIGRTTFMFSVTEQA